MNSKIAGAFFGFAFLSLTAACQANESVVLEADDLAALAEEARERGLPLLVMFSAEHCEYCERLEADFLGPMLRSGNYADKVIIRQLKIDRVADIRDFQGKRVEAEEFADRYDVQVTPTVMLFDAHGRILTRRLVGLSNPYFYGGDLDRAIDRAYGKVRQSQPSEQPL